MGICVTDISIDLGGKHAKRVLDQVSFEAREGEFLSLLGASGAGKSTLLKVIAGILFQDSGSIAFDGEAVDGLPAHKRKVGFVFQDMRLFPNMNVEENIAFPCKMAKMPKRERLLRARYLLSLVHLEGFGKRDISSLSGGQQQRVALVRALAAQPQVLLLDEPFSGLDENLRDEMRSLVLKLHREFGITTILVTHDATEALEMSDRIVYISEGRVVQQGNPTELYEYPASHEIAACFGECSVLTGKIEQGHFKRGGLEFPVEVACDGEVSPHAGEASERGIGVLPAGFTEGDACLVVRYAGVSAFEESSSNLCVRCSVYRGDGHLLRIDVDGQTLTVPVDVPLAPGTKVEVQVHGKNAFIYPSTSDALRIAPEETKR